MQKQCERRDVRLATVTCYRCKQLRNIALNRKEFPGSGWDEQGARGHVAKGQGNYRNKSGNENRAIYQSNRR
jgi:hypothetical protein